MSDLELISEDEKHRILFDFNSAAAEFDPGQTFADLLDMRVSDSPEKIALICGNEKLTYKQLDELSNSLANKIIKAGAKPEDIVCLMADKSIRMIVALIAIVKSGAAYLCVESDLPANRKKFMLKDSGAKMLIANKSACSGLGFGGSTMYIEDDGIFSEPSDKPAVKILPGSLAYIIYTSGTSGEPKGVLIEHKSLVNYIYGFLKEFKYTGSETVLQQSSYSFDAFVEEVYPTLAAGASLVIANKYGAKDMKKLAETIEKHDVNIVSVSPLVLNELNKMGGFESIDLYISGGDVLKYEYMDKLIEKADVYNTYGPYGDHRLRHLPQMQRRDGEHTHRKACGKLQAFYTGQKPESASHRRPGRNLHFRAGACQGISQKARAYGKGVYRKSIYARRKNVQDKRYRPMVSNG